MSKYYIARNKDNTLRAFQNRPAKHGWNFWDAIDDYPIKLRDTWFPEVKWTDKEPRVLTIEESPWIKVEDKCPNIGDLILVMYKDKISDKIYYSPIAFNGWDNIYKGYLSCDAIAWMSIPEFKE